MAGKEAEAPRGLSTEQDDRLVKVLRDDLYDSVLYHTDWDTVLSSLVKSGFISEDRLRKLTNKPKSDAAASFQALLMRAKSQVLRRGFLKALKESATSVPKHNMLLSSLTKAAGVDMKSLEEEDVVLTAASGMSAVCVCVCVFV